MSSVRRASLFAIVVGLCAAPASAQESALDGARAAVRSNANDPAASLAFGRALRRAGRIPEAITELRRGTALWGGRTGEVAVDLHVELARAFIAQRDFGQAMVQCKVAGNLGGGAARGHACAAEAHLLWKRASEAHREAGLALAGGAHVYDAKVADARAFALELKEKEAEAALREAVSWKPEVATAHVELGKLLASSARMGAAGGDRTADAVRELREALRLDPASPEASYELGRALGSGPDAAAALERALHERPSYAEAAYRLGELALDAGKLDQAREAAERAKKYDPQDAGAHVLLGRVALAEGKPDAALDEARAALGILANSAPAKLLTGDAWAKKGEVDLAVESYQAAYGLDHSDPAALVNASVACHAAGRDTSAKAFAEKATMEYPDWAPAWVALGDALVADKDPGRARAAYDTALKSKGPLDRAAVQRKIASIK